MQKKLTRSVVLLLMSLLAISIFYACLEEPFIEPSKIPFTVLRIGNLTSNVDELGVVIDGEYPLSQLQNLQKNEFTEYFDLVAGRRYFAIVNLATGDTVYRKYFEVQSFEEQTFWYSGYVHPSIDTSSADFFQHSDAFTYLSKDPPEGHLNIYFLHASGTTPDTAQVIYNVEAVYDSISGTDTTAVLRTVASDVVFGDLRGISLLPREYRFVIRRAEDDVFMGEFEGAFQVGMWSWLYITGDPISPLVVREDKDPLPARPKN